MPQDALTGSRTLWMCSAALLGAAAYLGSSLDPDVLLAEAARLLQMRPPSPSQHMPQPTAASRVSRGPLPETVYDRGLVNRRVHVSNILREHQAFYHNTSRRAFSGVVVGFVSPWAARADEMVWRFSRKLTFLVPILFEATMRGDVRISIGNHAGRQWLRWLRAATQSDLSAASSPSISIPKLTPLVSLERLDLLRYFTGDGAEARVGELLLSLQEFSQW